jgi:hypothetical protein
MRRKTRTATMFLNYGPLPESLKLSGEDASGWRQIKEPKPDGFALYSAAVSAALAVLWWTCWSALVPELKIRTELISLFFSWTFAATVVAVIVVHEVIHLVFHPHFGASKQSVVGFWPKHLLFYAQYFGVMSRNRYVAILLAPFALLSVMPLLAHFVIPMNAHVAIISFVNALFAAGDILGACILILRVPPEADVVHSGWYTLWRTRV